jgi:N-methylhydantoinase A/oxoprolinase/acetone carboxylase beta subunit
MSTSIDIDIGGTFTDCYVTRRPAGCKTQSTTYDLRSA